MLALGSWGGQRPSLAPYAAETEPRTGRAPPSRTSALPRSTPTEYAFQDRGRRLAVDSVIGEREMLNLKERITAVEVAES